MRPSTRLRPPVLRRWRTIPGPARDATKARLLRLYRALWRAWGPQDWWPARGPWEVAVGAVLAQNTAWTGAARAVAALRRARVLTPAHVLGLPPADLGGLIRPSGTWRLKAGRLRVLAAWLLSRSRGRFEPLRRVPLAGLRRELLAVPGLGPETADSILLYALDRPVFVADAYLRRVLVRHRLLPPGAGYEAARTSMEAHLPSDPALFNEYHALVVALAKAHCRTVPVCTGCPLRYDLDGRRPART